MKGRRNSILTPIIPNILHPLAPYNARIIENPEKAV